MKIKTKYIMTKLNYKLLNIKKELIISLLQFLYNEIIKTKKKMLTNEELEMLIKNDSFQRMEEANCSIEGGSHYLRILDSIFENNNPKLHWNNDNGYPSKELLKEIKIALKFMKKDFLKDEIELFQNYN